MNWDSIAIKAVEMLLPVLVMLVSAAVGYGVVLLKAKASQITNQTARDAYLAALSEADRVAYDAVAAVNQQLVDDLKAAASDGKLTPEERSQAMESAKDIFLAQISAGGLAILEAAKGPVDRWLRDLIEAKVSESKAYKEIATTANPS